MDHQDLDSLITQRFVSLRKSTKMSQRDIASAMDVSVGTIKLLEGGGVKWNTKHLTSAAGVLGVEVHDLIPKAEAEPPTPLEAASATGDPAAILRALADQLDTRRVEQLAGGDSTVAELLNAYHHGAVAQPAAERAQAWHAMMMVLTRLRVDWGIDPPPKERKKGRFF